MQLLGFDTECEIAARLLCDDPNLTVSQAWDELFESKEG